MPNVGSVDVSVVPSAQDFVPRLRQQIIPGIDAMGAQIGRMFADNLARSIREGVGNGLGGAPAQSRISGRQSGDAFAGEFDRQVKTKIAAALRSLPPVSIGVATSEAEQKIRDLRADVESLRDQRIGIDISESDALAKIEAFRAALEDLGAQSPSVQVKSDTAAAIARLEALKAIIDGTSGTVSVTADLGAFESKFQAAIAAARSALPEVTITANSTDAERAIARLRAELAALSEKKIGVDIDATTAKAELDRIKASLDALGARSTDVQVRLDAAKATAELAAFQAEVKALDGQEPTVRPDVDPSRGIGGIQALIAAGVGLAPALIPVAAACVAALAAVGTAAAGAAAGAGVAFAALKPVVGALQALGAQQTSANPAQAAQQARAQADAIASANAQVQSSEASLANARASAASGAVNAAQRVSDAQRQAASSVATAEQGVTSAEQALTNAQTQARTAQTALTDARKAAKQQLEDYKLQLADGALAQRAATLAIAQAKDTLDKTNANSSSTDLQRQQAQLAYDQAKQQNIDLGVQQARLKDQAAAAAKAGVDGSKQVQQAQAGVATSAQGVATAQTNLAKAQAAVVEAQRKGAEQVASAQRASADQARTSAASIASAQASVASAERAVAKAHEQTGAAGVSAANKVKEAFAGLTPAGASFARFLFSLKDSFGGISKAAQNGLLPGLQTFIESLLPSLPKIEGFVGKLATAMGNLFVSASKALTGPFWTQFFKFLDRETPKWLTTFSQTVGNVATGLAGLFQALAPVSDSLNGSILDGTKAFADWATSLGKNKGFQEFLAYLKESLPQVGAFLGAFAGAAKALIVALAPLGSAILVAITQVLKFIGALSPVQLGLIAAGIGLLAIGIASIGPIMAVLATGTATFGAVLGAITAPIAAVVLALIGFGILVTYLYKTNETFRRIVDVTWAAVKMAVVTAWEKGIKPAFMALWSFLQEQIFPTVRQLWNDVVKPAFTQIGQIISITWSAIILPALKALWSFIQNVLAPVILFLLKNVVIPVFKVIGTTIALTWQNVISPALTLLGKGIRGLGGIFQGALDTIKSIWSGLAGVIRDPIRAVLQFTEDYLIKPLNKMLGAVGVSFRIPDLNLGSSGASPNNGSSVVSKPYARGGWTGPGGKFQPAGIVHADEFVIRKESQNAIAQKHPGLLDYMNVTGRLPGHASGGLVGALGSAAGAVGGAVSNVAGRIVDGASLAAKVLTDPAGAIKDFISSMVSKFASTPFAQIASGAISAVGGSLASKVAAFLSGGGGVGTVGSVTNLGGGRVSIGGKILDATTAGIFQKASGILGGLNLLQGSYSTSVGASGGTHAGAGAMDVWPANGDWHRAVDVLRSLGDVAWHRTPSQGPWAQHIHGITPGIPGLSPAAQGQLASFRAGRNGLGDNGPDNHGYYAGGFVKPLLFDSGGYLPTGVSMVRNDTGKPEPLKRADQDGGIVQYFNLPAVDAYEVARHSSDLLMFQVRSTG